ncbi:tripartite tricarboxylate transporter permease [Psychromarinibacter sp. C21-152]|uniref:Tripartite tricarboxylate transporter permease n=1 Tax=Psychromarinibacter sediminicola TaxID=3033385 RepID=A0AAE3TAP0_9RHOB|nr:tripartite tricarboxylate transporter permease [Psychromarinibacter sediminicola]MDF0603053.1 tripartite tricarboxylate transporter permease [Psychromarinibacter sediminicola]
MVESFLAGMQLVFTPGTLGYLLLGVLFGLWLGAVPGLGGIIGVVIILPFTFSMDAVPAMALILGVFAVTATSDTIASVMLGIPGTAASQATVMDGYPMAQNGQAARAFGAAFTASAVGGVAGGIAMAVSLPIVRPLILSFGTPEFFLLGALGLTMVATVSGAAVSKGLAAACIGLMLSQIGFPVASEEPRYWFEIMYLIDGLPLVPLVLGLFALPEMLDLAVRHRSISRVQDSGTETILSGIRDAVRNWWLVLRCSFIGIYIGMLPGLGGMIADWVAYGHASQSVKQDDGPGFGNGDVRGLIAPEAANNAVLGGALIPTVGLGIPGSASMAILLGAFTIQGLAPGRAMLSEQLDLTFSFVWMLILANIVGAALLMMWSRQVAKLSFIDGNLIVPGVLVFVFMGAWLDSPDLANWITVFALGAIGYVMKRGGWPRPALVLGFVLGPVMESALVLASQTFSWTDMLSRPLALVLLAILALAFVLAVRSTLRARRFAARVPHDDRSAGDAPLSMIFGLVCLGLFLAAIPMALPWSGSARLFPLAIAPFGAAMLALAILRDIAGVRAAAAATGGVLKPFKAIFGEPEGWRALLFFLMLAGVILITLGVGQLIALTALVLFYLRVWAGYGIWPTLAYGAAAVILLELVYGRILYVRWFDPIWPLV